MNWNQFEDFQKEFDTKIEKSIFFIKNEEYKFDFHSVYRCKYCNINWWLSDPDNHKYGYFLKEEDAKSAVDKDEKNGKITKFGCITIIMTAILVLIMECV